MRELKFNVLSHEVKATKGQNGQAAILQEVKHVPRTFWEHLVAQLPSPEEITVASGKVVQKGIVLTPTMALTLFLAICAAMGTVYWRMSDRIDAKDDAYQAQRDLLIRMDQRLIDKEKHDAEKGEQLEKRLQNMDAMDYALKRDIAKVEAQRGQ